MSTFHEFIADAAKNGWVMQVDLEGFQHPVVVQILSTGWTGGTKMIEVQGTGDDESSWMNGEYIIFISKMAESKEKYQELVEVARDKRREQTGEVLANFVGLGKDNKVH